MGLSPFKSIAVSENHPTFAGEIDFEEKNKWSVDSGQWKVDSVKFGANKTFVPLTPPSLPLTPFHSLKNNINSERK